MSLEHVSDYCRMACSGLLTRSTCEVWARGANLGVSSGQRRTTNTCKTGRTKRRYRPRLLMS